MTRLQIEADTELAVVLARAATNIRLEWTPPACPLLFQLDDWFDFPL